MNASTRPKCYVLDMFPYPSGTGLHVGHPLGYIASDIYSRYKRLKGFNVLHPMGFDSFGLPAEQYALDTGQHPAETTKKNIATFKAQLDNIGFCYDWDREIQTSDPSFYKWTQWIFLQLFDSYYDRQKNKAENIALLIEVFQKEGNVRHPIPNLAYRQAGPQFRIPFFRADEWKDFDEKTQQDILMQYRLAYCGYGEVNWCEALGTVLANDEVVNGVSERGGYPVVKKKLRQWYLRITEYADRLLEGLGKVDFSEAMKEMQTNWIGKSSGAEINFQVKPPLTPPKGEDTTPKYQTAHLSLYSITKMLSEEKRKNPTPEELIMWQLLLANKTGFHIRRQHIIGTYIVDFACLDKLTTIEIDGGYHNTPETLFYDKERTAFLKANGFTELRFTNEEVKEDAGIVVKKIIEFLSKLPSISRISESSKVSPLGGDLEGAPMLKVYTTRPDTIFGVDFMVISPEHELVEIITTAEQKASVEEYIAHVKSRSERERMAEKKITGVFTGAYALNPFNGREIPIWISEYVLAGYGTGAIMGVPCGDERDHKFAKHFNIPITNIIGTWYNGEEANPTKEAILENSDFINGLVMKDAMEIVISKMEELGIGVRKVNYKMRDAAFSRQRYWGEPFPIKWINGIAYPLDEMELPLELPHVEKYTPGPDGEGPLANIPEWIHKGVKIAKQSESSEVSPLGATEQSEGWERSSLEGAWALETNTMPGYAGSSWYFLRYMDPHNDKAFCDRNISDYWNQVDLYIGGTEHAVGHLLYSRMWTKFLYDMDLISFDEPYKKLVNQGMITGKSYFIKAIGFLGYKIAGDIGSDPNAKTWYIVSNEMKEENLDFLNPKILYSTSWIRLKYGHQYVNSDGKLSKQNFEKYLRERPDEYLSVNHSSFLIKWDNRDGEEYIFIREEVEKMSKSKFNVENPDDIVSKYGADTFRMYEMFLGPVEMSKPWDTKGIEGVHRFLKKFWRLFADETKGLIVIDEQPTPEELKVLHQAIKKIESDTERFSFNTAVSAFMIATNELSDLKCHKRSILEPLLILLAPYAPHIAEELYYQLQKPPQTPPKEGLRHTQSQLDEESISKENFKLAESSKVLPFGEDLGGASILNASYPKLEEKYLIETTKEYPISINGKLRTTLNISLDAEQSEVEKIVLENEVVKKWLAGNPPKKLIYVKDKMINVVI